MLHLLPPEPNSNYTILAKAYTQKHEGNFSEPVIVSGGIVKERNLLFNKQKMVVLKSFSSKFKEKKSTFKQTENYYFCEVFFSKFMGKIYFLDKQKIIIFLKFFF